MFKNLKLTHTISHKLFIYSDLHQKHDKDFILSARGFKSIEDHDKALINNWNSKISNKDVCFLLGDFMVGCKTNPEETFDSILNSLNFSELYLMQGNHGSGWNQLFQKTLGICHIDEYFRLTCGEPKKQIHLIPNYYEVIVNNQLIILSHYPILSWRDIGKGSLHIFGHEHSHLNNVIKGKCLDITPESVGNFPLDFDEIKNILDGKPLFTQDHH